VGLWAKSGLGPLLITAWAALSPYPPFSLAQWLALQLAAAPRFVRFMILYNLGEAVAKRLIPGLYTQLFTGTMLGLTKTVNYDAYLYSVATRLQQLLAKQAKLRGVAAPAASRDALAALQERLKADQPLAEALGSTTTLGIWHHLERTQLDDKALLERFAEGSQPRWVVESLQSGFLGDVEVLGRESAVASAAKEAARQMRALTEAVDAAAFGAAQRAYGAGDRGAMTQVQKAADAAAAAMRQLEKASQRPAVEIAADRTAWEAKLVGLEREHAGVPAVAAELRRLRAAAA